MASSGGDLFDMAKDGTTVPQDAAKPNVIPSKAGGEPNPDTAGGMGVTRLHEAADNSTSGSGGLGEAMTGTGDALPESTTDKPYGKGHGGKEVGTHAGNRKGAALGSRVNRDKKADREPDREL